MNITESEQPVKIIAKTCGCKDKGTKITYSFIDAYHSLCIDKKDIISSSCHDIKLTSPRLEIEANIFTRLSVITADRKVIFFKNLSTKCFEVDSVILIVIGIVSN